jgi:hypothetical protein
MILDVVPTLGADLFQGWPESLRPSGRQVTLAWCFVVALGCSIGAASMLGARRLLPRDWKGAPALFGYAAALVCFVALAVSLARGTGDAYLPLITVMPALLAVTQVTMARRVGPGMRVVSVAFQSSRPWLERLYLTLAFRVVRPLLLLAVLAVALSRREYNVMLAGFALAFALIWFGSWQRRARSRETGMLRAAALVALLAVPSVLAAAGPASPLEAAFDKVVTTDDASGRRAARNEFETLAARQGPEAGADNTVFVPALRKRALALVAAENKHPRYDIARDAAACLFLLDPTGDDSLKLERQLLDHDGVAPFPRLDEAFSDYEAGEAAPLLNRLGAIHRHIGGDALTPLLAAPEGRPAAQFMVALAADLRSAWCTWRASC